MKCSAFHRCIALLCLLAFGLGQTVFASVAVRCTDASGVTRLEYACVKSTQGSCITADLDECVRADDDCHESEIPQPAPCDDEPLGLQASAAKVIRSNTSFALEFVAVVVAILWDRWSCESVAPVQSLRVTHSKDRPPDTLACLRSVILMV